MVDLVTLRLNQRTNQIEILRLAEELLDQYYVNNKSKELTINSNKLESHYVTFSNITKLLNSNYTEQELLIIANYIYHLKGSKFSLDEFNRFFDCNIICSFTDYQIDLNFIFVDVNVTDINSFVYWYKQLVTELLFFDTIDISILKITTNVQCINELKRNTSTSLINNVIIN